MSPEFGDLHGGGVTTTLGAFGRCASVVARVRPMVAETIRATVLFVDLRGYTGLAERLAPVEVASMLDEFFGVLAARPSATRGKSSTWSATA
jgi:class 3 adenylate cyclase